MTSGLQQGAAGASHHLQEVLLQRLHGGQRLHLQHASSPVDQSRLTWSSFQTEPQPAGQDLTHTHIHTHEEQGGWCRSPQSVDQSLTCRL